MQIHIYTTQKADSSSHSGRMVDLILKSIARDGLEIGAECPDVVHLWGRWDSQTISEIKRWRQLFTPIVFSSIEGLAEICSVDGKAIEQIKKKNCIRKICRMTDVVVAQGREEQRLIFKYGHKEATVVLNPYVTSLTDEAKCTATLADIYCNLYASHDKQMMTQCEQRAAQATDEPIMQHLISQTLYTDYLFRHGTCHDDELKALADAYIKAEMADEDAFARLLSKMKILAFVARLMAIMKRKEMISEGFMPIDQLDDKRTAQLEAAIKSRSKQ